MPIAARSAEMWFTTNTIISEKEGARLEKEEYVKGKKRSRIDQCSHGLSSGMGTETSTGGRIVGAGRIFGSVGFGSGPEWGKVGRQERLQPGTEDSDRDRTGVVSFDASASLCQDSMLGDTDFKQKTVKASLVVL